MTRINSSLLFALAFVAFFAPALCNAQSSSSLVASAYDRVKDQVNDKTFLVVRADLTAFDAATFVVTLDSAYTEFLKERGFNDAKIKSSRHEFHGALDAIKQNIDKLEEMRNAFGIREIFLIVQNQADKSARLVVPGAPKELAKQMTLLLEASTPLTPIKTSSGYAFATNAEEDATIYRKFKAGESPQLKRFYQSGASGEIQIFCSVMNLENLYRTAYRFLFKTEASTKLPESVNSGLEAFDSYFQQAKVSIDVSRFTIKGSLEFTTAERAEDAYKALVALVDALVDNGYESNVTVFIFPKSTSEKYNLKALNKEMGRASLKATLPKRVANSLIFEFTPDSKNFWSNTLAIPLF